MTEPTTNNGLPPPPGNKSAQARGSRPARLAAALCCFEDICRIYDPPPAGLEPRIELLPQYRESVMPDRLTLPRAAPSFAFSLPAPALVTSPARAGRLLGFLRARGFGSFLRSPGGSRRLTRKLGPARVDARYRTGCVYTAGIEYARS